MFLEWRHFFTVPLTYMTNNLNCDIFVVRADSISMIHFCSTKNTGELDMLVVSTSRIITEGRT